MILKMLSPHRKLFNTALNTCLRNISMTSSLRKSHYDVLEVKRDATAAEIKNAYFRLSKMYHPDKIAATDDNLKKFREVTEAYEVLGNDHSRKLYDSGLLGDIRRVGMEAGEATDPIVEFYRKRQDMSKILGVKQDGIGVWKQSSFADAKTSKQHDLFSMKTNVTGGLNMEPFSREIFFIVYFIVVAFLLMANYEDSKPDKLIKYLKELFASSK